MHQKMYRVARPCLRIIRTSPSSCLAHPLAQFNISLSSAAVVAAVVLIRKDNRGGLVTHTLGNGKTLNKLA